MSLLEKNAGSGSGSEFEAEAPDHHLAAQVRGLRRLDAARAAATLLALAMGAAVLGLAGHNTQVYNASHLRGSSSSAEAAWLSLWPSGGAFDFRPTAALLAGAALVVVANLVALTSHHGGIRARLGPVHTPLTFSAPCVGLVAAVVAVALFYAADRSATADTLTSWSCRWRHLATARPAPAFGALCRASRAAVDLAILLVPVEALALALAGWQCKQARYVAAYARARRTPSPGMG